MSGGHDGDGVVSAALTGADEAGSVPPQRLAHPTGILLEVGEPKILQFARKPQITAIAELVWNALDANATTVKVGLQRTSLGAVSQIVVSDDGDGITPDLARRSFREYGDS